MKACVLWIACRHEAAFARSERADALNCPMERRIFVERAMNPPQGFAAGLPRSAISSASSDEAQRDASAPGFRAG